MLEGFVTSSKRVQILALSPGSSLTNLTLLKLSSGGLVRTPERSKTMSICSEGSQSTFPCSGNLSDGWSELQEGPKLLQFLPDTSRVPFHTPGISK